MGFFTLLMVNVILFKRKWGYAFYGILVTKSASVKKEDTLRELRRLDPEKADRLLNLIANGG